MIMTTIDQFVKATCITAGAYIMLEPSSTTLLKAVGVTIMAVNAMHYNRGLRLQRLDSYNRLEP